MSAIKFYASSKQQLKNSVVPLTKHESEANSAVYYTYSVNGKDVKYTNKYIVSSGSTYIGKNTKTFDVKLTYNEGVDTVEYQPAHYTYVDNEGNVQKYVGEDIVYDAYTNTYSATVNTIKYVDEYVTLIEE